MVSPLARVRIIGVALLVLILILLPYLFAAQAAAPNFVFGGFLLNPLDGNTYLAKIYQGWQGAWRFRLPHTAEAGEGAYLFLYYLLLGHLARWLGLPLLLTFHLARLLGGVALLLALFRFFAVLLPDERSSWLAFALAALGSGLGWLALPFGVFTSDFWVAETYPFLSAYTNPHFPLGLALLVWLFTGACGEGRNERPILIVLAGLALAIVQPFGIVVAAVVLGGVGLWEWLESGRKEKFSHLIWLLLGGGPVLLYDFWAIHADPILAGWDAQNLTPSPPPWDLFISLSPALWLALVGAREATRRRTAPGRLLLTWAGLGLLILYVPFSLQRRFMLGLFVPVAGLAAMGLESLAAGHLRRFRWLVIIVFLLALPTNLIVILTGLHGAQIHDLAWNLTRGEAQALAWLAENSPHDALVLAAPDTGPLIPAHTGRRVLYGHPFETVNTPSEKAAVTRFFQEAGQSVEARDLLARRGVNYVFFGPREQVLSNGLFSTEGLQVVYQAEGVTVFAVLGDR